MSSKNARKKAWTGAGRNRFLILAVVLAAFTLEGRVLYLQLFDQEFLTTQGELRHLKTVPISAHRGPILDRRGEPLAVSTPVDTIGVTPRELDLERVGELAAALGMDEDDVLRRVTSNPNRDFLYLMRQLPPADASRVLKLGIQGVSAQREYRRFYPRHEITAHILGFTDIDDNGQEGLELTYDHHLRGEEGAKRILRDERGRVIEEVDLIRPSRPGGTLTTSIDLRLQYLAYRELKAAVTENGAKSGSAVILKVDTGEVLAMVNQPSFNPNNRSQRDAAALYRNRAITDLLEPGSSFKPFIAAAALELEDYTPDTIIDTSPGYVQVGAQRFSDTRNLGPISLTTVLARSSNVGAVHVGLDIEPKDLWSMLDSFGIGRLTGTGLTGESFGRLYDYALWGDVRQATLSFGYNVNVTTLQLAGAYSVFANGGLLRPLSVVALDRPPAGVRVISERTARDVTQMLEAVVAEGSGSRAAVNNYRTAGKTGTSRKIVDGQYSDEVHSSIFVGFAPVSDPEIVIAVVIDEPGGEAYYGGDVAAPVFANIARGALRTLAVPPDALEQGQSLMIARAELSP